MPFYLWKQTKVLVLTINFNVIKHCFGELYGPLKYLSDLSLQSGVFPELMKFAVVSPVFKTGDTADICNYCQTSVLLFSQKSLNVQCAIAYTNT